MSAEQCLEGILKNLPTGTVYYELGVLRATNLVHVADTYPNIQEVVGIDSYLPYTDNYVGNYTVSQELAELNKHIAITKINASKYPEKIKLLIEDIDAYVNKVPDNSIDIIFIDTGINCEAYKNQISTWYNKVKPGGIFCGHDWYSEAVKKDTPKMLSSFGYTDADINIVDNEIWWIKKHD